MRIVKLDAIDSTNTYLKGLMQSETLEDFTVVTANHQQYGRGQMGSKWKSEPGLNLIMSVLKRFDSFQAQEQFFLVVWVSLAVLDALKSFEIPNLSIKWPNDIMSGNRKIGGILIENSLKGPKIQSAVIGVGLNVNQSEFVDLPNATSMKLCFGRDYEINEVLEAVLRNLQQGFITYEKEGPVTPWTLYAHLEKEFVIIRAGKASPAMLSSVLVEYYGSQTPISQVANINTPDARTITVQPWEKNMLSEIEKAIMNANLGFNPMNNGDNVIINVPPLTEERRRDLVKQAKAEAEHAKVGVRNARQEANKDIRGLDDASEDVQKNAEADVQELTDRYIKKIDSFLGVKEAEIMKV